MSIMMYHTRTPFGLNSWDSTSDRQNLDLATDAKAVECLDEIDKKIVDMLLHRCDEIFGKALTREQIVDRMKPSVTQKGDYPSYVRTKCNTAGSRQVRTWDLENQPCGMLSDLRGCTLTASIHAKSLWFMGSAFGVVFECTDLQVEQNVAVCPFGRSDSASLSPP